MTHKIKQNYFLQFLYQILVINLPCYRTINFTSSSGWATYSLSLLVLLLHKRLSGLGSDLTPKLSNSSSAELLNSTQTPLPAKSRTPNIFYLSSSRNSPSPEPTISLTLSHSPPLALAYCQDLHFTIRGIWCGCSVRM